MKSWINSAKKLINNISMTNMTDSKIDLAEDEISLLDIIRFFIDNKVLIAISSLACGALGLAYGLLAPAQYEATMNLQMAMVANKPVETPNVVVEKMKLPLYFSADTRNACGTGEGMTPSQTLNQRLKPVLNKNAPFIGINFRASSPEAASACLQAVLEDIRAKQEVLASPLIKQKQAHLQTMKDKLASAEEVTTYLSAQKQNFQFKDEKFSANALILATRLSKDNEIKELRNEIVELEISLSPPETQETALAAPLYASSERAGTSRSLIVGISLLAGFMLGIFFVLARKTWHAVKGQLHTSTA